MKKLTGLAVWGFRGSGNLEVCRAGGQGCRRSDNPETLEVRRTRVLEVKGSGSPGFRKPGGQTITPPRKNDVET